MILRGVLVVTILFLLFGQVWIASDSYFHVQTYTYILSILGILTPAPSPDANLTFYGAILAAIIGAIIVGLFGLFQFFRSRKYEHENQRIRQRNEELQRRLDKASQIKQFENEIEKMQYENILATRREALVRERERKASTRAAVRAVMVQAQTPGERVEAYRKALHADTNISQLQILDMAYPMEVTKIYVRLRLHQETRLRYDIDAALLAAEERGDPNTLIKARYALLETRSQAAMTPEEALQKYPRCIVLGDPGAGKSTLLKYLTLQSVDQQLPHLPDLPVHIALGDFASSTYQDLLRFAAERWDEWYGFPEDEAYHYIESRLSSGSAILLLDALDETVIGGSDERARCSYARVLAAIDRVAVRYSKVPIVVTARKAGYYQRPPLSGFTELEVLDFRPQEMEEFVNNWFKHHPMPSRYATATELNAQLTRNSRIQSLASNPLLLSLIVMVYELRLELPERRAEIYRQCVDVLLFRWDTSRDIRRRKKFKAEHKQDLLTEVAWHFHTRGRRYFPEDELLQVIADFLPTIDLLPEDSKGILHEIEEENGLLKEQAHGWHGFLHLTLQEYFVAQYLSNAECGLPELLKHCGDPWWEEVTLLYVGSIRDASPFLLELLRMEKRHWLWEDIFHTPLLWVGQCLAAKPRRVQRELRDEIITRLFHVLRKTPYTLLTREQVTKTLLSIDSNDARGKLLIALKDKKEEVDIRRSITRSLGKQGSQSVIPDLLTLLKDKQEETYIRKEVTRSFVSLGDKSVIPALLALLKDKQENIDVRGDIAQALGTLGDQTVIPDLLALLRDKQEESIVRRNVARAFGVLGYQDVVPDLIALLKDKQENGYIRDNVARALGVIGDKGVIPDLLVLLKDKQEESIVRGNIAEALGVLGEKSVIPDLLVLLKDKQEESIVRGNIAEALAVLGDKGVIPDLLVLLKRKQEESIVRENSVEALGVLGDKSVIPDLLALLKDKREESNVRFQVAKSLIKMGKQESVFPYFTLIRRDATRRTYLDIASDFMYNYESVRIFARLLQNVYPRSNYIYYDALWESAQREKVRILMFRFWRIKLVRVVRH